MIFQGTPGRITVGSKVWVEDPEIGWIHGDVSEINGKKGTIITSSERTVSFCCLITAISETQQKLQ